MTDLRYYIMLASDSGAYKDIELEIMKEALLEWERRPDSKATLVELASSGRISGFAYYSPVNGTEFTYELKWIVVDKLGKRQGIGDQLLERVESEILRTSDNAILVIETSSVKEAAIEEGFFEAEGYSLIGRIPDFYGQGDNYLMYAYHLSTYEEGEAEGTEAVQAEPPEGKPSA